jgi:glycosyltransferase involved in cell wall biosynthesis
MVTGITVCYNSKELIQKAYESVRRFHPEMQIIIVDGSDKTDLCREYVESLKSEYTTLILASFNIGHGRGMDLALQYVKTKYALIFDSDIIMHKSPVEKMLKMMDKDTYGVGYLEKTGFDGFEYGAKPHHYQQGYMYMLHPYFMLLQVKEYFKYHRFVHHGAPCFKAALDIHRRGLTNRIIKEFPGLGHSSGKGWNWIGQKREYIEHHTAGTRKIRRENGLQEIEPGWER